MRFVRFDRERDGPAARARLGQCRARCRREPARLRRRRRRRRRRARRTAGRRRPRQLDRADRGLGPGAEPARRARHLRAERVARRGDEAQLDGVRLRAPLTSPTSRIFALGTNFRDHTAGAAAKRRPRPERRRRARGGAPRRRLLRDSRDDQRTRRRDRAARLRPVPRLRGRGDRRPRAGRRDLSRDAVPSGD